MRQVKGKHQGWCVHSKLWNTCLRYSPWKLLKLKGASWSTRAILVPLPVPLESRPFASSFLVSDASSKTKELWWMPRLVCNPWWFTHRKLPTLTVRIQLRRNKNLFSAIRNFISRKRRNIFLLFRTDRMPNSKEIRKRCRKISSQFVAFFLLKKNLLSYFVRFGRNCFENV